MAAKKKKAKRDACYSKVKARYTRNGGTWPSAYGSGALVKCRKVGAKNWGNKSGKSKKKQRQQSERLVRSEQRQGLG